MQIINDLLATPCINRSVAVALIAAVLLGGGCASSVTFPASDTAQGGDPFVTPCCEIMGSALKYAHGQLEPTAPLIWNLPAGTDRLVWEKVGRELPADARCMRGDDATCWSMKQLRLDGSRAQVDVVYRTPQGVWQMVTVHFEGAFGATYRPLYLQRWLVPVDPPVCGS